MALYRVSADIEYLDGNLAGLVLRRHGVMPTSRNAVPEDCRLGFCSHRRR